MTDFGNMFNPRAAKLHRCEWCLGPIVKGEKHANYKGLWEGDWQNWRMHDECYADMQASDMQDYGFTPGDGEMPERIKRLVSLEPTPLDFFNHGFLSTDPEMLTHLCVVSRQAVKSIFVVPDHYGKEAH